MHGAAPRDAVRSLELRCIALRRRTGVNEALDWWDKVLMCWVTTAMRREDSRDETPLTISLPSFAAINNRTSSIYSCCDLFYGHKDRVTKQEVV